MEGTRSRILDAALRRFSEQGYRTSTIRQLAADVGLTSAALYYYFPSKEACLEALIAPHLDEIETVLTAHPPHAGPSRDERHALLADYLAVLLENPPLTRLIDRDPAVANHAGIGERRDLLVQGLLERLAGADPSPKEVLSALAALGALRRPVLSPDLDVAPLTAELVDLALRAFDGESRDER